jgi:hypothetical protein
MEQQAAGEDEGGNGCKKGLGPAAAETAAGPGRGEWSVHAGETGDEEKKLRIEKRPTLEPSLQIDF